jgi:hypothetical protein
MPFLRHASAGRVSPDRGTVHRPAQEPAQSSEPLHAPVPQSRIGYPAGGAGFADRAEARIEICEAQGLVLLWRQPAESLPQPVESSFCPLRFLPQFHRLLGVCLAGRRARIRVDRRMAAALPLPKVIKLDSGVGDSTPEVHSELILRPKRPVPHHHSPHSLMEDILRISGTAEKASQVIEPLLSVPVKECLDCPAQVRIF